MPFDKNLAARIRDALARKRGVEEKKMFGGVGWPILMLMGYQFTCPWRR